MELFRGIDTSHSRTGIADYLYQFILNQAVSLADQIPTAEDHPDIDTLLHSTTPRY
jgi:hypothetical protein